MFEQLDDRFPIAPEVDGAIAAVGAARRRTQRRVLSAGACSLVLALAGAGVIAQKRDDARAAVTVADQPNGQPAGLTGTTIAGAKTASRKAPAPNSMPRASAAAHDGTRVAASHATQSARGAAPLEPDPAVGAKSATGFDAEPQPVAAAPAPTRDGPGPQPLQWTAWLSEDPVVAGPTWYTLTVRVTNPTATSQAFTQSTCKSIKREILNGPTLIADLASAEACTSAQSSVDAYSHVEWQIPIRIRTATGGAAIASGTYDLSVFGVVVTIHVA
jgi:hypothetical protein